MSDQADVCTWYVVGGLSRASCDKNHSGHGMSYEICPYCGKPVRLADGEQGIIHMGPDQADGLRELVAGSKKDPLADIHPIVRKELEKWADETITCDATSAVMSYLHSHPDITTPTPDKARLWDELKAELERESDNWDWEKEHRLRSMFGNKKARTVLDRMLTMETFAMVKPETPDTFDRVKKELGVRE